MFRSAFLKRVPLFVRNLSENVLLCLLAAGVESTSKRVLETVVLDWRKSLTGRIHKLYFDNMVKARPHITTIGSTMRLLNKPIWLWPSNVYWTLPISEHPFVTAGNHDNVLSR